MNNDYVRVRYVELGLQYLIAAKFATTSRLHLIAGNLYHHGIEILLKSYLLKTYKLADTKNMCHNLLKIWNVIKSEVRDPKLDEFDGIIQELDRFEKIRYPDKMVTEGAAILTGTSRPTKTFAQINPNHTEPIYEMNSEDMDQIINCIVAFTGINFQSYTGWYDEIAKSFMPNIEKL